jgi:hypothetical protein
VLAVLGLATLLAMLIVFLRAVKAAQKPSAAEAQALEAAAAAEAGLLEGGEDGAPGALPGVPTPAELPPPSPAELEDRRVRALEYATKDPVGAAIILASWLGNTDDAAALPSEASGGAA